MAARQDEGECDWLRAHAALSRLARERAAADAEEGRWLLCALRSAAHVHLGCGSFAEYIERLFGYKPRSTQEKLRVAEALETLSQLANALETGALSWCAARELTRVAVPDTEQAWIAAAQGKTTRQLERLVAGKSPGDEPAAPASTTSRHVLRFEVEPETFALFREAMQRLRRCAGGTLTDDAALLSMARCVLTGPGDDGRAGYQVSLTVCAVCGSGGQQAGGELVPVGAEVVAMAHCDAQHLGELLPLAANENATAASAESSDDAHVGVAVGLQDRPLPRARQSVPPALRRAVLARDQRRCRVPGCTNATFVDVHHLQPRADGGRNEPSNLVTLCGAHHRATHRGELLIEPMSDGGLRVRHADGTNYGHAVKPEAIDVQSKVFSALRQLGFPEREVRGVLEELRREADPCGANTAGLLREALRRIRLAPR